MTLTFIQQQQLDISASQWKNVSSDHIWIEKAQAQSDQGFRFPLTKPLCSVEYNDG